jgi:hypothetical protein
MICADLIMDGPHSCDSPNDVFGPHLGPAPIRNSGKRHITISHDNVNIVHFDLVIASQSLDNGFAEAFI